MGIRAGHGLAVEEIITVRGAWDICFIESCRNEPFLLIAVSKAGITFNASSAVVGIVRYGILM